MGYGIYNVGILGLGLRACCFYHAVQALHPSYYILNERLFQ